MTAPDLSSLGLSQEEIERGVRYLEACDAARAGDPRAYIEFQWPGTILDTFQWDILYSLVNPGIKDIFCKGNTGCGKGAATAIAIVMWYDLWKDAKIRVTSKSMEHATDVMFAEVCKWMRSATFRPAGQVLKESIWDNDQHLIKPVNPEKPEGFSGFHGEHTLFVIDEGTAVDDDKYMMAYTQAKKIIVLGNPRTLAGAFREAFGVLDPDTTKTISALHGPRRLITIDGADCLNVRKGRLDAAFGPLGGIDIRGQRFEEGQTIPEHFYCDVKPIIPGQTCLNKFLAMCADPNPFVVRVLAHARFPEEDPETQLILPSWLGRHTNYWNVATKKGTEYADSLYGSQYAVPCPVCEAKDARKCACNLDAMIPVTAFGLDPASSLTGDETVLACGGCFGCRALAHHKFAKTSEVASWVLLVAEERFGISLETGAFPVAVDTVGLGKGVADRLVDCGVQVIEIKGNASPNVDPQQYFNLRTEMYGLLAMRLCPDGAWSERPFGLPAEAKLREELCALEKIPVGGDGMKFKLIPKDNRSDKGEKVIRSVKQRIGRSPDRGDAVAHLYQAVLIADETMQIARELDPEVWQPIINTEPWASLGTDGKI